MAIFRSGIKNPELEKAKKQKRNEEAAAAQEEREAARAEQRTALIAEIVEQAAQNPAQGADGSELIFSKEQVSQMLRDCLNRDRAMDKLTEEDQKAARLARDEMMLSFRTDLADHGMPAAEIIDTFTGFDFTTPEGLRNAVDDLMDLYEIIDDYAAQYEATIAAKRKINDRKPDIIQEIFKTGGHF